MLPVPQTDIIHYWKLCKWLQYSCNPVVFYFPVKPNTILGEKKKERELNYAAEVFLGAGNITCSCSPLHIVAPVFTKRKYELCFYKLLSI